VKKMAKNYFVKASRKNAVARCMSKAGTGKVRINGHALEAYYSGYKQGLIKEPMILLDEEASKLDYFINVKGGGVMSQVQAARACIAKSILAANNKEKIKEKIMKYDRHLLVDDVRQKEPKKQLGRGARKKKQHSKR
jgi:small subunit ribosomal protein S9